jgi:hypothetical protein
LMAEAQKTDRWSFAFLLPPGKSSGFSHQFGIPEGNVQEWEATNRGVEVMGVTASAGIDSYYNSRSKGLKGTSNFFQTDMQSVRPSEVKAKLTNMRNLVIIAKVNRTCMIREFVERDMSMRYVVGHAFYQLMKDETIQDHKKVILRERGKDAVYGGQDGRDILGLPNGRTVKVRPGNHAEWDIFIQSTSVNRRLLPGTELIYLK